MESYRFTINSRTSSELGYLDKLEQSFNSSPYSAVEKLMNFPLYTPRQDVTSFLAKYEIFKRVLNIQGSVVECGVLFGGGLMTFAQLSSILEPTNHQRKIIGFDTFTGFDDLSNKDKGSKSDEAHTGGFAVDSYEEIKKCISLFDMNRFIGHLPKVELIRGDATITIPTYIEENQHLLISLLYLDFDVYEPTRIALEHFRSRMPKGAIIVFDELNLRDWPGETVALLESLDLQTLKLERFPFGSTMSFAEIA